MNQYGNEKNHNSISLPSSQQKQIKVVFSPQSLCQNDKIPYDVDHVLGNYQRKNHQSGSNEGHIPIPVLLKQLIRSNRQQENYLQQMTRCLDIMAKQHQKIAGKLGIDIQQEQNVKQEDIPKYVELVKGNNSERDQEQSSESHNTTIKQKSLLWKEVRRYWIANDKKGYQELKNKKEFKALFIEYRTSGKKAGLICSSRHFSRKVKKWKLQQQDNREEK